MGVENTDAAKPTPSVTEMETSIQDAHDADELEAGSQLAFWNDEVPEEVDNDPADETPADWNDVVERETGETVQANASKEQQEVELPAAVESPAAETAAAKPDPVMERLEALQKQNEALAARLEAFSKPPEPEVAAPPPQQEANLVEAFDAYGEEGDSFREGVLQMLQVPTRTPQDYIFARAYVASEQHKREMQAQAARVQALYDRIESQEREKTNAERKSTLDKTFEAKMASYEAVDDDVKAVFYGAAAAAVRNGVAPQVAIDTIFGKLGKLLKSKTAETQKTQQAATKAPAVAAVPAQPARKPVSPAQEKMERAVSAAGRSAVRATSKKNTTASLAALEGGLGWGR